MAERNHVLGLEETRLDPAAGTFSDKAVLWIPTVLGPPSSVSLVLEEAWGVASSSESGSAGKRMLISWGGWKSGWFSFWLILVS